MTMLIVNLFAIIIAITVHEVGHNFCGWKLGDSSAKDRITLNPMAHLDPIGIVMMLLVGICITKTEPIDSSNFKRKTKKRDIILVSLAGTAFNLITAIVCAILMKLIPLASAQMVLIAIIGYNLSFGAFHLLPISPLDGWQIVKQFIPYKYYESVYKYESMSMFIFLIMIFTNVHMVIMGPIYNVLSAIVVCISNLI